VDRIAAGAIDPHETACVEFAPNAGLWCAATFRDDAALDEWARPVEAAFRFLADAGLGGERGKGWGLAESVEFQPGEFPQMLLPDWGETATREYWLLSLFSPAAEDFVDWSAGAYSFVQRAGVDTLAAPMTAEGSVIVCQSAPVGAAIDAMQPSMKYPRRRAGFAVAIPLPAAAEASA
jgi:CRISPR type III-A-associated RAMP protein Csm4